MKPQIKICCISSIEEAKMAINHGASALGLVGEMPSGPGPIDDDLIQKIAKEIPPPIATFLLTSEKSGEAILDHHKRTQTNTIQIVDRPDEGTHKYLQKELPNVKRVQVIHVTGDNSIDEALFYTEKADLLLLDSGNTNLDVKELGGTGRTHNWDISREIVKQSPIPVFLAGGLDADNVKKALDTVQPFGIDVCSGVRTNGNLDPKKLKTFIKASGFSNI
ncbi:phosphoribosylanthranilate isomerase [Rhodohalobacter sulfatireducens]|uniref:N-(5'-phosphoribosyl)anthranilate isomerase n=1 Tax=Rhodohalobacter sulfatireducens TaxID=2911366 RepID=A0ABS9KFW0_9BACT|nr:phosphoribosylanthranilate isomerase [Rhodohalobacter sulfatireducens]MCG2589733.1 phosphoribosylanthranilate isomerase [Rhodohalobacter sulfatireducens]